MTCSACSHGGLWQPLRLLGCGDLHARPDGVAIVADAATGEVRMHVEFDRAGREGGAWASRPCDSQTRASARVITEIHRRGQSAALARAEVAVGGDAPSAEARLHIDRPALWSPDNPALYEAHVQLIDAAGQVESHVVPFGFRSLRIDGTRILLNDSPIVVV